MEPWIDYDLMQDDLVAVLQKGPAAGYSEDPLLVDAEIMERDQTMAHMPQINVRLTQATEEVRSIPDGYFAEIIFNIDVVMFDLTNVKNAARIRSRMVSEVKTAIRENRQFSQEALTAVVGPETQFQAGTLEGEGASGFVAAATFVVTVQAYT